MQAAQSSQIAKFHLDKLILLLSIVSGVLVMASLTAYPLPGCDEATCAGSAVSLMQDGRVALQSWGIGEPVERDLNALLFGRTYAAGLALLFTVFGRSLFVARLFSLLGWLCACSLMYRLAHRVLDQPTIALLAILIFATSVKAVYVAHFARPESWLAAAILLMLKGEHQPMLLKVLAMADPDYVLIDSAIGCGLTPSPIFEAFIETVRQTCDEIASIDPVNSVLWNTHLREGLTIYQCH